jgi:hypothetical protein
MRRYLSAAAMLLVVCLSACNGHNGVAASTPSTPSVASAATPGAESVGDVHASRCDGTVAHLSQGVTKVSVFPIKMTSAVFSSQLPVTWTKSGPCASDLRFQVGPKAGSVFSRYATITLSPGRHRFTVMIPTCPSVSGKRARSSCRGGLLFVTSHVYVQ